MKPLRKAVFPVAGLGTRFLPATKANPKEMLPVVDKPLIQYAVEEAVAAGFTELIFITGRNKRSIPDHFDKAYELEAELAKTGNQAMLDVVRNVVPEGVTCIYIRQTQALGLGHAVLCAAPVVGDEPFAVVLADDLIALDQTVGQDAQSVEAKGCLSQMTERFARYSASILGVQEIPLDQSRRYGVIAPGSEVEPRLVGVAGIVEKPPREKAPSNLGVVGRYILTPRIFDLLRTIGRGAGGEIQLTDAIAKLILDEPVYGYSFRGKRYDCGDKLGYLQATVEYGLSHPELGPRFRAYLEALK